MIYRIGLQQENNDDGDAKAIIDLEKELPEARQPAKAIIQSLLADLYWSYLRYHRRQLADRTQTQGSQKNSIGTWTLDDLHNKIATLYLASIGDQKLLKDTKLEAYDPIIIKGNMRVLRPTLFDLLAHRALEYFKTDEQYLTQPENIFELDDPSVFTEAATFVQLIFKTPDSLSLHYKALQLFQQLIRFHLNDTRPDALLDVDIERLTFVHNYAVMDEKESAYLAALRALTDRWGQEPVAAQAWYLLALDASTKAGNHNSTQDTAGRYGYVTAKAICEKVLMQKDSSEGKSNCAGLLVSILRQSIKAEMEDVNLPEQPMRALITWRNLSNIHGRIVSVDLSKAIGPYRDDFWKKLLRSPAIRTFHQPLPATADYQSHSSEIKVDALPIGEYALIVDADSTFDLSDKHMAMVYFQVSGISYISNGNDVFVLNRQTGKPIANATVQMWALVQKAGGSPVTRVRKEVYHTDAHGYFYNKFRKRSPDEQNVSTEITTEKDHLYAEYILPRNWLDMENWPTEPNIDTGHLQTYFFTDRSIYRPGQKVYFKGILISETWRKLHPEIKANLKEMVWLKDANSNKIDSIEVTTNDYGSFHGEFKLPEQLLNGEFSLQASAFGGASFSVEEYKRPTFFVDYDTLKSDYRIRDTIRIAGYAKAYAGNAVDGATVKYRVTRQVHYFYPCSYCIPLRSIGATWGGWGPINKRNEVSEIAHGTIKTDASGKFYISFPATPDKSIDKNTDPVFEYTVSTDIMDINGETRSGERIVRAGYKSLILTIDQPSESSLPSDSLKKLLIRTTNLSGEAVSANVHVAINTLQRSDRMLRERRWAQPDLFILSKDEYTRLFPHDIYDKGDYNAENWQKGKNILDSTTLSNSPINLGGQTDKKLAPGWYVIEATATDKDGQTINTKLYLELYDASSGRLAIPTYRWAAKEDQTVAPGEKAVISIGSSAEQVFVIRRIYRGQSMVAKDTDTIPSPDKYQYLSLNKDSKIVEMPVTEDDRGGFWVTDVFVKDNNIFKRTYTVHVPWTNKQLSIRYDTYREKTLPGAEEKWKITINGSQKDKVTAEIMAGMYDASLDQFKSHAWTVPDLYPSVSGLSPWDERDFDLGFSNEKYDWDHSRPNFVKTYDALLGITAGMGNITRRVYSVAGSDMYLRAAPMHKALTPVDPGKPYAVQVPDLGIDPDGSKGIIRDTLLVNEEERAPISPEKVQVRKNFSETAFFLPELRTDDSGSVSFSFTLPDALTRWKGMILAHTKDLAFGYSEKSIVTQKQLMVQPNLPRFLREGDRMELGVKVVNLSDSEMTGQIELQLTDPTTGQTADGIFSNRQANQYFTVAAGQSTLVDFPIDIPYQYNRPLTYRIIARSKAYSDGEEAALPVVSNRMLVTESLPLDMPGDGSKEFHFEKLLHSDSSETLSHHALTVEFTTNPAWYAVQALPYLMEYPYECAEQSFNRFYANALAATIIHSSPRIQAIFDKWRTTDTAALLSNLEKNQELKSVLLQETPWVLQGKSESQQKQHIAMLFDMARMSRELESTLTKVQQMQSSNGGFIWFKGGPDDRYITQYIITGIGRLQKLNAIPPSMTGKIQDIVKAALPYLDGKIKKDYEDILREKKRTPSTKKPAPVWIGEIPIDYLYMRSFFPQYGIPGDALPAISYFRKQAQQQWLQYSKYMQGMIALALFRTGDVQTGKNIIASLKETAIRDEEKGMYWKGMESGYYWWQAPIETQSLLVEAFHEIANAPKDEAALKTWLLRQKQTHSWSTTKATADACYALLMPAQSGAAGPSDNWLTVERNVDIQLGNKPLPTPTAAEAGTGYFKQVVDGARVQPSMGNITVTMKTTDAAPSTLPAWGAVYWQYFENLDKITAAGNTKAPLRLVKKLFIEKNTDRGPVLEPLTDNGVLHPGDKVKVRIELRSDRNLEYVHMKDMRASCMEPVNVLSQYKWQDGLGYYESTKDASTDFFFASLPKGTYVFEYPLFVGQKGNFSNGVTSIECMYAPEFGFHSEGIRVNVEEVTP
ncbi:MAG TPA: alpha-2-macroglobulin family protein [Puia sp.]|nr:alpha-2-macroglobulin family protein [Puia sp.]